MRSTLLAEYDGVDSYVSGTPGLQAEDLDSPLLGERHVEVESIHRLHVCNRRL